MSEHAVFSEGMREIAESFVVETQDLLDELNADLLQLERAEDPGLVDKVFRAVHTVKGTSSFLGLDQLNTLAHHFEEVLNQLRKQEISFRPEMMDVLFEAFDQMAALLQQVLDRHIRRLPLDALFSNLKELSATRLGGDGASGAPGIENPSGRRQDLRVPRASSVEKRSGSVRVDVDRLDDLISLVGELAASRNSLARIVEDLESAYGPMPQLNDLYDKSDRIDALASEIRSVVLMTRMVTVERVFGKFPRVARDLGRSLDKDIQIRCHGTDTPIDRVLADEVGEALLHLIRNAIDHGIEPREERAQCGKSVTGTIELCAEQHMEAILISVRDDGKGLDPDAIRRKAMQLGRLSGAEAAALSDDDVFNLIWETGFSTTATANEVSGRGVGMNIVRTSIDRLGGTIETESSRGHGTLFRLRLPQKAT